MFGLPIVSIMTFLPIVGAFFVMATKKEDQKNAKLVALWTSFFVFVCSLLSLLEFDFSQKDVSNLHEVNWIISYNVKYRVGLDKFSSIFVPIISLISFLSILWVFKKNMPKAKQLLAPLLIFESMAIGAFCADDMFLLFVFMEASVIPLIMIFCWEKEKNTGVIIQFIAYTFASALILLIAIIMIYTETKTSNLSEIYKIGVKNKVIFWLILTSIGIKMPVWPFYQWLPNIHVNSPTVCSVVLASVVLKFSTLLVIRFIDPMFLSILFEFKDLIFCICIVSIIFATAQLVFQNDLKRFFAYFSIIHMNMYFLIFLSGIDKKYFIFAIMSHSIVMATLFFSVDIIKSIFKTRLISELKLLTTHFSNIKNLMFGCILVLIGVPFSWGFVSEILALYSCVNVSLYCSYVVGFAILASSMYAVYVYYSTFGNWNLSATTAIERFHISNYCKKTTLYILFFLIILFGILPGLILHRASI